MARATPIMRTITVTTSWQALSATSLVLSECEISCAIDNSADVLFRTTGETSVEVPWEPSEFHRFTGIDLATIEVKGTAADIVTVVGQAGGE